MFLSNVTAFKNKVQDIFSQIYADQNKIKVLKSDMQ